MPIFSSYAMGTFWAGVSILGDLWVKGSPSPPDRFCPRYAFVVRYAHALRLQGGPGSVSLSVLRLPGV